MAKNIKHVISTVIKHVYCCPHLFSSGHSQCHMLCAQNWEERDIRRTFLWTVNSLNK